MDASYFETFRLLAAKHADIVIVPIANNEPYDKWRAMRGIWGRVQEAYVYGMKASLNGWIGGMEFTGKAGFFAPCEMTENFDGVLKIADEPCGDEVIVFDLEIERLRQQETTPNISETKTKRLNERILQKRTLQRRRLQMLSKRTVLTLYASGYLGIAILTQTTVKWYQYYYTPPALNERGFEVLVPIAFVGIAMVIARIVDGIADPIVAYFSDRSTHPYGRRTHTSCTGRSRWSYVHPVMVSPVPVRIDVQSHLFDGYVGAVFRFFTIVVTPYLALIGELTETKQERIQLTTMQGSAQVIGVIVAEAG